MVRGFSGFGEVVIFEAAVGRMLDLSFGAVATSCGVVVGGHEGSDRSSRVVGAHCGAVDSSEKRRDGALADTLVRLRARVPVSLLVTRGHRP